MSINFNKKDSSPNIEIVISVRDKNGNPTGKTKSFSGDSCQEAKSWFDKQKPKKRKKRKKNKKADK